MAWFKFKLNEISLREEETRRRIPGSPDGRANYVFPSIMELSMLVQSSQFAVYTEKFPLFSVH